MTSLLVGIGTSILLMVILIAGTSKLLLDQKIGEGSVEPVVTIILFLAAFLGCFAAQNAARSESIYVPLLSAGLFTLAVLIGALTMDGTFQHVALRLSAIVVGGAVSCVLCLKKGKKVRKRKSRHS